MMVAHNLHHEVQILDDVMSLPMAWKSVEELAAVLHNSTDVLTLYIYISICLNSHLRWYKAV